MLHSELYVTGTGQHIEVHERTQECLDFNCVIHNPSEHSMRDFPTHWRNDRGLMERICPHGVGHPDPDDLAFKKRCAEAIASATGLGFGYDDGTHGCDGCGHD